MRVLLALICFIAMLLHSLFGYFLYTKGENIFYPEQKQIEILSKTEINSVPKISDGLPASTTENTEYQEDKTTNQENKIVVPKVEMLSKNVPSVSEKQADFSITDTFQAPVPLMKHPEFNTGWAGFLQVENAVVTFILFLLGFSICCINGRGTASRWVFGFNLVFWSTLTGAVWFFHPTNTPLNILRLTFNFPEWYFVLGASGLASVLSLLLWINAFRAPIDKKKKNNKAEPTQEPSIVKDVSVPAKEEKKEVSNVISSSEKIQKDPELKKTYKFGFGRFSKKTEKEEKIIKNNYIDSDKKDEKEPIKVNKNDFSSFEKPIQKPLEKPLDNTIEKPNNIDLENKEKVSEGLKDIGNLEADKQVSKPEEKVIILGNSSIQTEPAKTADKLAEPIIPKNDLKK